MELVTPSLQRYLEPFKSVPEQLLLLETRGMKITDTAAATACLHRIGYGRLSGYWHPFRKSSVVAANGKRRVIVEDDFRPGTTFEILMELYVFDKRLRLLFLDAMERVEIALRVHIALLLGARDPWSHRDGNQLHPRFSEMANPLTGQNEYKKWLDKLDRLFRRSQDPFATHFQTTYPGVPLPIWIAVELWDFGMLSVFLNGMKIADQRHIASKYGLPRADLLSSWTRNSNNVRNICAHHSRLWNRSPADQSSPPRAGEAAELDHLATDKTAQTRIYATAAALQFLLRAINPNSSWAERLKTHCVGFPSHPSIALAQAGFPAEWQKLPLWN
jgi:abortive infection bacteriophage resistance protein